MSRIEKALEKAAELRNKHQATPSVSHVPSPVPIRDAVVMSELPAPGLSITPDNPLLVPLAAPLSQIAEEYRKLKSVLVKMTRKDEFKNIILVTSSVAGEGKSLTSLNLAISLAQEYDHTVLLVDADLRRPSIHRYLGITPEKGLSDCLQDSCDVGEALINTGIGRLVLLPAGNEVPNPVELFSSQRMERLLFELKHRYPDRYVILDTPPVLPFAEVQALSHLADGVLFVVKERLAPLKTVQEGLESLKGCNLLGIVYNDAEQQALDSHYSYRYAERYAADKR
jgi:receptor protein-tyrosine kinase/non-specific protein-tyrosine kinase